MAALEPDDPHHIGRYGLLRRLGEGGMGRVYLGASPAGRAVAIKVVRPELAGDREFRARFRAEVEAAQKVSGAFTSPVVDADPDGPVPWLATAYVNGLNLKETIERHGPMPEPLLRTLGAGLGEALVAIHEAGLLHRDLKPANILLAKDGPRVIDFGISKATDGASLTSEGQIIGSPGYMSPEQIRGGQLTTAADVFAFGAVLAFAATGRPPYGKGTVPTIIHRTLHEAPDLHGVPASLAQMVTACLSRDPDRRPLAGLLPKLLAAPPVAPGWLPDAIGHELQQREDTLVLDLRALARARTRRRLLTGGAAATGLAVIGGGTAAALATTRGGKGHQLVLPKLLWRTAIKGEEVSNFHVLSRAIICSADRDTVFRCYSLATGQQLWSSEFGYATTGPTLIYALARSGGTLTAMDESRTVKWTYNLPERVEYPYLVGPTDGVLALTDQTKTIVGLNPATGSQLWIYRGPAETSYVGLSGIQGRTVLAAARVQDGGGTQVLALDTTTGAVRWSSPHSTRTVLAGSGNLCFSNPSHTTLDALSIDTGQKIWSADLPNAVANPGDDGELSLQITVANGLVYTGGPTIYALDAATGRIRWTYTPTSPGEQERTFLINGRYAYILDNPQLVALDARTGRRLWSVNTPAARTAGLVAAGGLICTGVGTGLYGWNAETGRLVWNYPTAADPTDQWGLRTRGPILAATSKNTLLAFHLG
ncbi:serine/threonine-protein kinase [Actinoallomurus purpureus]|uniref:protein kinase domain-containing protein n=1 Tax=Actinoallomurus purpureus TaxID=478114 RepID=UPI002092ADD9|nr:PQQ-binding-like beta-propeller repeat protein [Actinoallomurus purpureus]MCO6003517.1 serine/threonine-protein kinase [Actinoallomurus purpureus]